MVYKLDTHMELHPLTLRFKGAQERLEEGFQDHFFRLSLPIFRWGFLLGILLYGIFGLLDSISMPEIKERLWAIRFFLVIPVLALGIAFSFHTSFQRYWQLTIAVLILVAAFGVFWMIVIGTPPHSYHYYVGNMLVIFFCFAFIRARFIWATAVALVMLAMFEITSVLLTDTPMPVLLRNNFFFIAAIIIGMVASYSTEYFARKNYFLMVLLDRERDKLAQANRSLKQRLEEIRQAQKEIKILSGLIPICANCKKIRDDQGYWNQIESYISEHSDAVFSHALCPDCIEELYGKEEWFQKAQGQKD